MNAWFVQSFLPYFVVLPSKLLCVVTHLTFSLSLSSLSLSLSFLPFLRPLLALQAKAAAAAAAVAASNTPPPTSLEAGTDTGTVASKV